MSPSSPGASRSYVDFEDRLLRICVSMFDRTAPGDELIGLSSFDVAGQLWADVDSMRLDDNHITALIQALQSLKERLLLDVEFSSGGYARIQPTRSGRAFVRETHHAEWIHIFREDLSPEHESLLTRLHSMSVRSLGDGFLLDWVDEFELMVALERAKKDDAGTYHPHMRAAAIRDFEVLEESGLIETIKVMGPFSVRPTYRGCVRIEKARPIVVHPDVMSPLRTSLSGAQFAGALRLMQRANQLAASLPYSETENAIKDATAALESALQGVLDESRTNLGVLLTIAAQRRLLPRHVAAAARSLWELRSGTPGIAHGGLAAQQVDREDALFAIELAAAVLTYLAARGLTSTDDVSVK